MRVETVFSRRYVRAERSARVIDIYRSPDCPAHVNMMSLMFVRRRTDAAIHMARFMMSPESITLAIRRSMMLFHDNDGDADTPRH